MTTRKAVETHAVLSTTGMTALMLLGAWCGSALASTEAQMPCPELSKQELSAQSDAALQEILQADTAMSPFIRTIDSSDVVKPPALADAASEPTIDELDSTSDAEDVVSTISERPEITTRLPGVSASELPRFRRHMFRTDI